MTRRRVVADTNVLISALLSPRGLPSRVVEHVLREARLLASTATMDELASRLMRPKFDAYTPPATREQFVAVIQSRAVLVPVTSAVTDCPDPDDNGILALAIDGRADAVVTGDRRHLLPLHPYRGIPILTARAFADLAGLR